MTKKKQQPINPDYEGVRTFDPSTKTDADLETSLTHLRARRATWDGHQHPIASKARATYDLMIDQVTAEINRRKANKQ